MGVHAVSEECIHLAASGGVRPTTLSVTSRFYANEVHDTQNGGRQESTLATLGHIPWDFMLKYAKEAQ